jgi:hypothetical protein
MPSWDWHWDNWHWGHWEWSTWGHNFGIAFGVVFALAVFIIPTFFFLLNLRDLLSQVREGNRAMEPGRVWLNFIPVFGLAWFIYTVTRVRDSLQAEFRSRGWKAEDDLGYSVGLTAGIAGIATLFLGSSVFFGWLLGVASLVCWIVYWVKTSGLKHRLAQGTAPSGYAETPPYCGYVAPKDQGFEVEGSGDEGPGRGGSAEESSVEGGSVEGGSVEGGSAEGPPGVQSGLGMYCPACGFANDPGDRFCRSCGRRVSR